MFDWEEFLSSKTRHNRSSYRQRRLCKNCEQAISDHNRSGLCARCYKMNISPALPEDGSKYKSKQGYIMVRVNGVCMAEHIYVWEQYHNRKLPKRWLVHHLNGIRDDNRPVNLCGMPKKNHGSWTKLYASQERVRELEKLLVDAQLKLV